MITIIGGTYDEWCLHPPFEEKNGSGLRACYAINSLDKETQIDFHTYSSEKTSKVLEYLESIYKFKITKHLSKNDISFEYDYPLRKPVINPRPDLIVKPKNEIYVEADNILYFGMLEGNAIAKGKKVVYDPQSPVKPIPFHKTKSTAAELAVVINIKEARQIVKSDKLETIKKYFFEKDNAAVLVIKMGPKGAMVFLKSGESLVIPVYKTSYVWPIGSGDVFASVFAYYWMENGKTPFEAAQKASLSTAIYCNSRNYAFTYKKSAENIEALNIKEYPQGKVYLAGPFFTYAQKWLINELRESLLGLNLNVFSPWHDVGEGSVEDGVAEKDIEALKECKIVFAVVDGFDSGTIFEIGYAVKQGIPVIAYVENESKPSLTMLTGTKCHIEKDMTTALYKCLWLLAENEQSSIVIGGIDSIALAYWKKPDIAFTLNYGQSPARKEIQTSALIAKKLNIAHHVIEIDCSSLGSGDLLNQKALSVSPSSEWWPFRNQLLITFACMKGVSFGISELMTGSVLSDGFHKDGTAEFYRAINDLMVYQEGNIKVTCPAINMTSAELVKTSGIPDSLLFWAHSCHKGNVPCGQCRGCNKYREVMYELGHI